MTTGEKSGTWGTITNDNEEAIEEAIADTGSVTFASAEFTLTLTNTNATQVARNLRLDLGGTSGGAQHIVVPTIEKLYIIDKTPADTITVKTAAGSGIAVPTGKTMYVYVDGTNVIDVITHLTSLDTTGIISVDDTTDTTSGITGSIHTDGGLGVAKNLFVATDAEITGVTTHGGNVISDTDSTDDLGTTGARWLNVFTDSIGDSGQVLDVDSSSVRLTDGVVFIKEQAEADADQDDYGQLWVDLATPNTLMFTDDIGTDKNLSIAVVSDTATQVQTSTIIVNMIEMTQAAYDAETPDANTLYIIVG